jgi:hypothetical protein
VTCSIVMSVACKSCCSYCSCYSLQLWCFCQSWCCFCCLFTAAALNTCNRTVTRVWLADAADLRDHHYRGYVLHVLGCSTRRLLFCILRRVFCRYSCCLLLANRDFWLMLRSYDGTAQSHPNTVRCQSYFTNWREKPGTCGEKCQNDTFAAVNWCGMSCVLRVEVLFAFACQVVCVPVRLICICTCMFVSGSLHAHIQATHGVIHRSLGVAVWVGAFAVDLVFSDAMALKAMRRNHSLHI